MNSGADTVGREPFLLAPSLLSADFSRLEEQVRAAEAGGADLLHLDVMDGVFVPNLTFGPILVQAVRQLTRLPLDVHLMITQPERYISQFATAGADFITVHVEATVHVDHALQLIKSEGKKAGAALNPGTPICHLENLLSQLDLALVMTVNPGFGGQQMIGHCLSKIRELRRQVDQSGLDCLVEVDGGVNPETISLVREAGAHIIVAGSAVFGDSDVTRSIQDLRRRAFNAE